MHEALNIFAFVFLVLGTVSIFFAHLSELLNTEAESDHLSSLSAQLSEVRRVYPRVFIKKLFSTFSSLSLPLPLSWVWFYETSIHVCYLLSFSPGQISGPLRLNGNTLLPLLVIQFMGENHRLLLYRSVMMTVKQSFLLREGEPRL